MDCGWCAISVSVWVEHAGIGVSCEKAGLFGRSRCELLASHVDIGRVFEWDDTMKLTS